MKRSKVKITQADSWEEREIVTALITNDDFLKQTKEWIRPELFESPWAQIVAEWCLEWGANYSHAPNRNIERIFRKKTKSNLSSLDEPQTELLREYLTWLSGQYEEREEIEQNTDYLIEQVAKPYFHRQALLHLVSDLRHEIDGNRLAEAESLLVRHNSDTQSSLQQITTELEEPFPTDFESIESIFSSYTNPLISFTGGLAKLNNLFVHHTYYTVSIQNQQLWHAVLVLQLVVWNKILSLHK